MFVLAALSVTEITALIVAITPIILAFLNYLKTMPALPRSVAKIVKALGGIKAIETAVKAADAFCEAPGLEKRTMVADKISEVAKAKGIVVEPSEVNLMIEWAYNKWFMKKAE